MATKAELEKRKKEVESRIATLNKQKSGLSLASQQTLASLRKELVALNEQLGISPSQADQFESLPAAPTREPAVTESLDFGAGTQKQPLSYWRMAFGGGRTAKPAVTSGPQSGVPAKTSTDILPSGAGYRDATMAGEVLPSGAGFYDPTAAERNTARVIKMQQNAYGWTAEQQLMRDQLRNIFLSTAPGEVQFQQNPGLSPAESAALQDGSMPMTPELARRAIAPVVRPEFQGYTFGPSQTSAGVQARAASEAAFAELGIDAAPWKVKGIRDVNVMEGMSVQNIYSLFYDLSPDELVKFQRRLMEAGLFSGDDKPTLGKRDQATRQALENLMQTWGGSDPDKPIGELLTEMKRNKDSKKRDLVNKKLGRTGDGGGTQEVQLIAKNTLEQLVDSVAVDLFGSGIDPARKAELVARLQAQDRATKVGAATRRMQTSAKAQMPDIDLFIDALIGQESSGNPNGGTGAMGLGQILPGNWDGWAREAGLDPTDMSAQNQRRVIESKVASMYLDYNNWDDVASALYPGGQSGGPSIQQYVNDVRGRMEQMRAKQMGSGPSIMEYEAFDPQATARDELMAMDPTRYIATQFRRQADVFFGMLAGVRR